MMADAKFQNGDKAQFGQLVVAVVAGPDDDDRYLCSWPEKGDVKREMIDGAALEKYTPRAARVIWLGKK